MSSGRKQVQFNTRERLISPDHNRLQSFLASYANEAMRQQMLAPQDDSLAVGTTFTASGALTTAVDVVAPRAPTRGGVLNGLMVVVPMGAQYVLVTAGMLLLIDPDGQLGSSNPNPANPDDLGPAKLVMSSGVQVAGQLAWTANAGAGFRVDVVECQRTDVIAETDNRDIFNQSTGMFSPQSVTKVVEGRLTFRIRQGVVGGGLPAPELGWYPLAVISAPAGAGSLDDCTVWDVRDLLSDLATPYANVRSVFPRVERYKLFLDRFTAPGEYRLSGQALGTYNGWKIGGIFAHSFAVPYTDIADAPNYWAAGLALLPSAILYVYALWPSGYVRWVKYHETAIVGVGGRCPGPFRGVLTVSHVTALNGQPTAPVALPTGTGLGGSTLFGMALVASVTNAAAGPLGFVADDDFVHLESPVWNPKPAVIADPNCDFAFVPGSDFPSGTNKIRVQLQATLGAPAAGDSYIYDSTIKMVDPTGANTFVILSRKQVTMTARINGVILYSELIDLPVGADGISAPPPHMFRWELVQLQIGAALPTTVSAAEASVIAWDL